MNAPRALVHIYPRRIDIPILILLSGVLLIVGLSKPVITVQKLWDCNNQSILSSVINLWKDTDYFLAGIILFFRSFFRLLN